MFGKISGNEAGESPPLFGFGQSARRGIPFFCSTCGARDRGHRVARNLADGGVEVHANGTENQLNDFESVLRRGPSWSEVRSIDVTEAPVVDVAGFQIR